jgi:hypothetical protein
MLKSRSFNLAFETAMQFHYFRKSISITYGITGNYYITSEKKEEVESVCNKIEKCLNSITFHPKYKVWVARIKEKKHKASLKNYLKEQSESTVL